ncbi:MAG: hypothetical protein JXR46_15295 [Calditrichaceae bacterium]|nr:hypothetical protein [Calditrichaceae bacterium]
MNTENTIREINELIEICDYKKAKKLSKRLIRKKIIDGYYLLTTVYDELDKTDKCIKTLSTGLKKHPDNWILWMRLGNYQSDKEEYAFALDSFKKALEQVNADKDYINLNLAILYNRWGKLDNAKETIDKVSAGSYDLRKLRVQLSILLDTQQYQEIIENISNNKVLLKNTPDDEYSDLSLILYFYSYALWKTNSIKKSIEVIKEALFYDRLNKDAYWLIREIDNNYSSNNKYFRILITGDWLGEDDKEKNYGFYSSYDIVADSEQKALDLIKEFETAPIDKDSVKIDEIEEIKFNANENPSGIYNVHGFSIFDIEE